ncbi:MAG: sigma 54-interacting transcriptional regulator [Myxococcota bacterium]
MPTPVDNHSQDLQRLAELASHPGSLADVFEGALQSLRGLVPYELAALYELSGDTLNVRAAAGPLASAQVRAHTLSLSKFPTIRQALQTRRPIPLDESHHDSEEGDPYDGVLDLPHGHSCMVVPLFAADRSLGIITLDRSVCGAYDAAAVELAGVYGQIVSIAMAYAKQAEQLGALREQLEQHNTLLREELSGKTGAFDRLTIGTSAAMVEAVRLVRQVGQSDAPVLVRGETGTGKELFAQAIHELSQRARRPFIKLNCAAIPENLVESELFGHVKGAFSGAHRARAGRFVTADGGTLLLDEIGDMPLPVQAKLLRVLQEGELQPLGSDRTVKVDVRVIAASHVDLEEAVKAGRFREDLYYRIAVFPVNVPPLRERAADIGELATGILADFAHRSGRGPWTLGPGSIEALQAYPWPGNVRQLVNVLERATIVVHSGPIGPEDLGLVHTASAPAIRAANTDVQRVSDILPWRDAERRHLMAALQATKGKIYGNDGAAQLLDLKPTTLQSKLKKHGIDRSMV